MGVLAYYQSVKLNYLHAHIWIHCILYLKYDNFKIISMKKLCAFYQGIKTNDQFCRSTPFCFAFEVMLC